MKLTKKQKNYISKNLTNLSVLEIASKLNISVDVVKTHTPKNYDGVTGLRIMSAFALLKLLKKNRIFILIIFGLSLTVYFNSFFGGFITGDDYNGYVENPIIRDVGTALSTFNLNPIYYSLMYKVFGINSFPLHIASFFMHFFVTILVFISFYMLFGERISVVSSILFVVHPINTEAISWISGGVYLFQAMAFYIILISFLIYKYSNKRIYLLFSILFYSLSLLFLQSPLVLMYPVVIYLIEQFFLEKETGLKKLWKYILYLAPSVIYSFLYLRERVVERVVSVQASGLGNNISDAHYINKITYIISMTLKLLVFPKDLTIYHEGEVFWPNPWLTMGLITALFVGLVLYFLKNNRKIAGLLIIIPVFIAPAFSPITIAWLVAERYLYIGTAFFCVLLAFLLLWIEKKFNAVTFVNIVIVSLIIIYSTRTIIRNNDWRNSLSLWSSTSKIAVNSSRVYNNLGDAYGTVGDLDKSIASFKYAIELEPNYADALHNLGNTYFQLKDYDSAVPLLEKSVLINPNLYQSYFKLGVISYYKSDIEKAKEYLTKTLELNPNYTDARQLLELLL